MYALIVTTHGLKILILHFPFLERTSSFSVALAILFEEELRTLSDLFRTAAVHYTPLFTSTFVGFALKLLLV